MTICYSYLLSLLFLLLITHWSNTASLRSFSRPSLKWTFDRRHPSFIVNNEVTTSEPILSRRRPQLSLNERRRRWSKDEDNDEVEIPIDETNNESTILSDDISLFNSTITEIKHPLLRQDLVVINQTDELTSIENNDNLTTTENKFQSTISNEISTESEISPTNVTDVNQQISNENATESEILPTNATDINQQTSNEKNETAIDNITTNEVINNEAETSSIPISINQTIEETSTLSQTELLTINDLKPDTAIILLDFTTNPPDTADANQTSIDSVTESISQNNITITDDDINPSTVLDVTQSDTTFIQERIDDTTMISDVTQSETVDIVNDEDEYSNETINFVPPPTTKPVCDLSCKCLKECPYGFEIVKDACKCDPPCQNYQCYGNDTCTVTKGKPICQPEKGSEHDRPIQCYQPRDAGYHDTDMRYQNRWYYNPDQDTCNLFVYRGLGGNANNYLTLHDCHVECITCAPAPDPGECLGYIPMWYYDYKKNQCLQFKYLGCKGNENKFLRKQECIDTCITRILNL